MQVQCLSGDSNFRTLRGLFVAEFKNLANANHSLESSWPYLQVLIELFLLSTWLRIESKKKSHQNIGLLFFLSFYNRASSLDKTTFQWLVLLTGTYFFFTKLKPHGCKPIRTSIY